MTDIDKLIDRVFDREGREYENVPDDRGGPTKFGITIADVRRFIRPNATWETVSDLKEEQARHIYKEKYFVEPGFNLLPPLIQEVMFDAGILHGPSKAVRFLQEILNEAGFGPVDVDGRLGPQVLRVTVDAAREMGEYLVNAIVEERQQHFDDIVALNPTQSKFRKGWSNRVEALRKLIDPREYTKTQEPSADDAGSDGDVSVEHAGAPHWYNLLRADPGRQKTRRPKHAQFVLDYFRDAGHPEIQDDETAWCAAAVGAVLERSGIRSTRSLMARSYENWGVELQRGRIGAIVVMSRGDPSGWQGHVGLYAGEDDTHVYVLGGNQKDSVSIEKFPKRRVLSYRWPEKV